MCPGVVVVLTGLLGHALIPMTVLVEIAGSVARMVMMLTRLLLYHRCPP